MGRDTAKYLLSRHNRIVKYRKNIQIGGQLLLCSSTSLNHVKLSVRKIKTN